jgi:hypothetical protein
MSTPVETLGETPKREPAINAPWTVAALMILLIGAHGLRMISGGDPETFALTSTDLVSDRFAGLVTYQFVHGGWTHVLMNAAFVLAFGAPVARYLGGGWRRCLRWLCRPHRRPLGASRGLGSVGRLGVRLRPDGRGRAAH